MGNYTAQQADRPVTRLVGPEGRETLIMAASETYVEDKSIHIVCEEGFVDVSDWR